MGNIKIDWYDGKEWDSFPWGFEDEISAMIWIEKENIRQYKMWGN